MSVTKHRRPVLSGEAWAAGGFGYPHIGDKLGWTGRSHTWLRRRCRAG